MAGQCCRRRNDGGRAALMLGETDTHEEVALVVRALSFAAECHRTQTRKDRETPYINHPITLMHVLVEVGMVTDPVVLAAAVLHDVVEDCEIPLEELEARFGAHVKTVVLEVTNAKNQTREEMRAQQVAEAATLSLHARCVKLADKICNLHDLIDAPPAGWDDARKASYFDWTARVAEGLRGTNAALEAELERALARRPTV
jgi:guanosine-3',5'-bis(diphosphate) 3'-pyrophosphohydrolase